MSASILQLRHARDLAATSVAVIARDYLEHHTEPDSATAKAKTVDLKHLEDFLIESVSSTPTVHDITPAVITRFLRHRADSGDKPATLSRRLATVKHFCRVLSEDNPEYRNPARDIRGPRMKQPTFKGLTEEEVSALRKVIKVGKRFEFNALRDQFLIELFLNTGLRCQEALRLNLSHYDEQTSQFLDVWRKGDDFDNVAINKRLRDVLEEYLPERKKVLDVHDGTHAKSNKASHYPLVISTWEAKPSKSNTYRMAPKSAWRIVNEACLKAGVSETVAHPHSLRHTFARQVLKASGNNVPLTARAMGHRNIQTTMRYVVHTEDEVAEALEDL